MKTNLGPNGVLGVFLALAVAIGFLAVVTSEPPQPRRRSILLLPPARPKPPEIEDIQAITGSIHDGFGFGENWMVTLHSNGTAERSEFHHDIDTGIRTTSEYVASVDSAQFTVLSKLLEDADYWVFYKRDAPVEEQSECVSINIDVDSSAENHSVEGYDGQGPKGSTSCLRSLKSISKRCNGARFPISPRNDLESPKPVPHDPESWTLKTMKKLFFPVGFSILGLASCAHEDHGIVYIAKEPRVAELVSVSLDRQGCYGSCPQYTVTFSRDGSAALSSRKYLSENGEFTSKIDPMWLLTVQRALDRAQFWTAKNTGKSVDDGETLILTAVDTNYAKSITDGDHRKDMQVAIKLVHEKMLSLQWTSLKDKTHTSLLKEVRSGF